MSNNKLNKDGVKAFWDRVFVLIKKITGDVDVKNKGTLQEQVNGVSTRVEECFTSVSNGKKAVANAITGKGISTAENAEFATMAENIGKIKSTPKLQSKSAALNTETTSVTMEPDIGYDGLSQATASIVLQEKAATLKTSAQNITPDSGKLLSKVSVPAVPGNAALTNVLAGKTFSSETAGVGKTGKMANKAGTTVKASAVSQDDNNTYLTISAAGYYDEKSKVYTENSNLSISNIVNGYATEPIGDGEATTTISIKIPSDNCIIIFAHPEDSRATTTLSLPSGATKLLENVTSAAPANYRTRYYIVKVTGKSGSTLNFSFSATGVNNKLYIRYVTINSNCSNASVVTSLTKDNTYAIVRNVDYRSIYNNLYSGAIVQYYDMPYTNTYFKSYQMANITVIKALENSTITTTKSGNYSETIIKLS